MTQRRRTFRQAVARAWRRWRSSPSPTPEPTPTPTAAELSVEGFRELARVVEVLAQAGVLTPDTPDPAQLREAVADYGEPVTAESALRAIGEADYYHPGFVALRYSANLAFHDSHTEQLPDGLQGQVHDLVRLAGEGLADVSAVVEIGEPDGGRLPTTVRLAVGGEERVLAYAGAAKYLSTELHVALARILHERRTGRRLAWLWCDQGVWTSGLPDGGAERLNAALGTAAGDGWTWVDENPPHAAGDLYPGGP